MKKGDGGAKGKENKDEKYKIWRHKKKKLYEGGKTEVGGVVVRRTSGGRG